MHYHTVLESSPKVLKETLSFTRWKMQTIEFGLFYVAESGGGQSRWSVIPAGHHTTSMRPPLARLFTIVLRPGFSAIVLRSGL